MAMAVSALRSPWCCSTTTPSCPRTPQAPCATTAPTARKIATASPPGTTNASSFPAASIAPVPTTSRSPFTIGRFQLSDHPEIDQHDAIDREFVLTKITLDARNNLPGELGSGEREAGSGELALARLL